MNAIELWAQTTLATVSRDAIERAVCALDRVEALALIRAAYPEEDKGCATLEHAKEIYQAISKRAGFNL